jgi:hypothetical protein
VIVRLMPLAAVAVVVAVAVAVTVAVGVGVRVRVGVAVAVAVAVAVGEPIGGPLVPRASASCATVRSPWRLSVYWYWLTG